MSRPQRYLALTFGLLALALGAVAAFNAATDPFGVFGAPTFGGRTARKPGLHNRDRMVKAYAIEARRPDALLLGTSRVQFGMDPDDPALRAAASRPYNAGLVNANVYMALRYLQHAHAVSPVKLALIGLDPLMFDATATTALRDFTEQRLAVDAAGQPTRRLLRGDAPLLLLSTTALGLSVTTWRHQPEILTDLLDNGLRNQDVLTMYSRANGSLRDNVALIERDYTAELLAAHLAGAGEHNSALADLRGLLDFARGAGIAVQLFFTPGHVRMLELMAQTHTLDAADRIRHDVVAEVAAEAAAGGGRQMFAVWDFSGPTVATCAPLPGADDREGTMTDFWETSHFRTTLGHRVLARMLGATGGDADFGVALTPGNVAAVLAGQRQRLAAWEAAEPAAVAEIAAHVRAEADRRAAAAARRGAP